MAKSALRTRRLWRRLGFREDADPEFVYAVQPVYNVGDGSALVPPTLPAVAWSGGYFVVAPTFHAALQLHSRAPGGCFIRELTIGLPGASQVWRWALRTAAAVLPATANTHEMGPVPTLSTVTSGQIAGPGLLSNADPHRNSQAGSFALLDDLIYVPAGSYFYMEGRAASTFDTAFSLVFSDVAEAIPPSAV